MRATIDGAEVFISEDQAPEFTMSVNELEAPSRIKGTRSTTIRVINTPEAARALGTEHMAADPLTRAPRLRLGQGSDEFSSDIRPVKHTRNEIECLGAGGNSSWFELAKATKLREMALGDSALVDNTMQAATWTDEESLLYFLLADFGALEERTSTYSVSESQLRPSLRVHRILEEAMTGSGWVFRPNGRLVNTWKKLVLLEPGIKPSIQIPNPVPYNRVGTSGGPVNPDGYYFVPSADGTLDVVLTDLRFDTSDPFDSEYDGVVFRVVLYDFTDKIELARMDLAPTYFGETTYGVFIVNHAFTGIDVQSGHDIAIAVQALGLDGQDLTMTIPAPAAFIAYDRNSGAQTLTLTKFFTDSFQLTDALAYTDYVAQTRLRIAECLPDWTLDKLITGLANIGPLVFDTDDALGVIDVWYDVEFYRKPSKDDYRDWTQRMDHSSPPAKMDPAVPRRLILKWAKDEDDRFLRRANAQTDTVNGYGSAVVDIPGGYGNPSTIEVPFAPTCMGVVFGTCTIPVLREFRGTLQQDNFERTTRLLIADGMATGDWRYDGVDQSEYPKCYFSDPNAGEPLPFDNAQIYTTEHPTSIGDQWDGRIDRLKRSRTLEAYFQLYDHELQEFDFGMPTLADDGSGPRWYYVQEIRAHRFGTGAPTRCKLVEIPGADITASEIANPEVSYPAQPFLCAGPGYASFIHGDDGADELYLTTSSGYFSVRWPSGSITHHPSGVAIAIPSGAEYAGSYCIWSSTALGVPSGSTTVFSIYTHDASEIDPRGLVDCVTLSVLIGPNLTAMPTDGMAVLTNIDAVECAFTEDQVDAIINDRNPTIANIVINTTGGTSAPRSAASDIRYNQIVNGSDLVVSGAGTSVANGNYALAGVLNGKNYYDKIAGSESIYWDGTYWLIATSGGNYRSSENVAEPWLVTTWTTFGASAPVPALQQPYPGGGSISTN